MLILGFFFFFLLAPDGEDVFIQGDLNILYVQTGKFCLDDQPVIGFFQVNCRHPLMGNIPFMERRFREKTVPDAVHLPPQGCQFIKWFPWYNVHPNTSFQPGFICCI
jgi:hypothetical protein